MAEMPATISAELVKELKGSTELPPYNAKTIVMVAQEISVLASKGGELMSEYAKSESEGDEVAMAKYRGGVNVFFLAMERNRRNVLAYLYNRMKMVMNYRWVKGNKLEGRVKDSAGPTEQKFFSSYDNLLSSYEESIGMGMDLTTEMEPPRDVMVNARVTRDLGLVSLESGDVNFVKDSVMYLKRVEVEYLIRDGSLVVLDRH
uniref:DNA replication complex GINS protein PSF1 n=1 Tax=Palpitomonas bilix TaxID=652834 RepID=A0A7S3CYF7_9EUKA|mmetsp:Transcript_14741/g.37637  ORF Transcript_14741/g.37637 Transcript_14741/m.37637 type:complete len:203 (+) Transcript_14741:264-872(+)